MDEFYVYYYLRDNGTPYYVGKGMGRRIDRLHTCPLPPPERRVKVKENMTEEESFELEKVLIRFWGRKLDGGILVNHTLGGEGMSGFKKPRETIEKQFKTRGLTLGMNKRKSNRVGGHPLNPKPGQLPPKPIIMIFPTGEVKPFDSVKECMFLTGIKYSTIYQYLKGVRINVDGYIFKYVL